MNKLAAYIQLTRLNKPIGIWLLFLPCLFGTALFTSVQNLSNHIFLILLFLLGAIIMRSAGCVINDLSDRKFDALVKRTSQRPLVSGKIRVGEAISLLFLLLLIGLVILWQFNLLTILLGFIALILVIIYPLTKRFTYYPQIFLGLAFNFGILMSSSEINNYVGVEAFLLYFASIIWTVIYDSFYGYQDIEDDLKIGVKSTAILFRNKPRLTLNLLAFTQAVLLLILGAIAQLNFYYYPLLLLAILHLFWLINNCDFNSAADCLQKFRSSLLTGIIIALAIFVGRL